jgi:GTP-binding protein
MKFIDEAIITVKAGHGGPGSRSFRREKYTPLGGPDGGNGGRGGSVILVADPNRQTLIDFKFQPEWIAKNGDGGGGRLKDGSAGKDLVIQVPIGTQVFRVDDETLVADITEAGQEFVLAKGGRGGKGNNFFKTPTLQAPEHAQPGEPGEEGTFRFSLKLLADVALVGMPNAGKSTLISRISAAKPKIADYPFTTLSPNLGVVQYNQSLSFVVADIPGLIPGAHEGKGLGIGFLKHIERTRVILHLLDCGVNELMESDDQEGTDNQISKIIENFEQINLELRSFSQELSDKPQIVVLSKVDIVPDPEMINSLKSKFEQNGHQVIAISSATGLGLKELLDAVVLQIKKASA